MSLIEGFSCYISCHPGLDPGSVKIETLIRSGIRTKLLTLQILKQVQDDDFIDYQIHIYNVPLKYHEP